MKTFFLSLIVLISVALSACSGGAGSGLSVKVGRNDKNFTPKSGWAYHSTKTFSYPVDGKTTVIKTSFSSIYAANYEMDTSQAIISITKQKIDKPEQVKVKFSITGDKDTSVDTPIKPGEYSPENKRINSVDNVWIYYFLDGKEKAVALKLSKMKGSVTIDSVSDKTVSGKIDVTDGENSVKGSFSVKGHDSVK